MNWEAIGAVGEIIGATAVVVTLAFLLVQLRLNARLLDENRDALRTQALQERTRSVVELHYLMIESPYLAPILTKIDSAPNLAEGIGTLDPEERRRLVGFAMSSLTRIDNQIYMYQQGLFDDDYYEYNTRSSVRARYPLWKALGILEGNAVPGLPKPRFRPGLLEEIDRLNQEIPGDA